MAQRADGKYGGPDGVNELNFGEKTSEHGHYALADWGHAGTNADGTKWKSQNMEWVEDDRDFKNAWEEDYRTLRSQGDEEAEPAGEEPEPAYEPVKEQPQETENTAEETYKGAFERAVEAGNDITANDYLMGAKEQEGSRNRFMDMAQQGNPLPPAETNDAAQYDNVKPPELLDIAESNSNYNGDLNNL